MWLFPLAMLVLVVFVLILFLKHFNRVVIFEYEKGLKYHNGRFVGLLGPGAYWVPVLFYSIKKVDTRASTFIIMGQEVISSDGVTVKISLAAEYEIADPVKALHGVDNYYLALYTRIQLALRELVSATEIENINADRGAVSAKLLEACAPRAKELGLNLKSISARDIMFPGKLKETFAQVVAARKEGQAALERARGETAALRSLANAAKMVESNPNLMQLRMLQVMGSTTGNTYILGASGQAFPIPVAKGNGQGSTEKPPAESGPEE